MGWNHDGCALSARTGCPRCLEVRPNDSLPVCGETPAGLVSWFRILFRLTISGSEPITQEFVRADSLQFRGRDSSASMGEETWFM
jgi:hypothetical protein